MTAATPDGECVAPLLDRPGSPPVMTHATLLGWHFVGRTLRDGCPVPSDGKWLTHDGPLMPCVRGLHASVLALDALTYAPDAATHICRVELGGMMAAHGNPVDKYAASERRILWRADPRPTLQHFARLCALDVAHLWDMPASVRAYLETGDEALWDEAEIELAVAIDVYRNRSDYMEVVVGASGYALQATTWAVRKRTLVGFVSVYAAKAAVEAVRLNKGSELAGGAARAVQAARLEAMMLALEPWSAG